MINSNCLLSWSGGKDSCFALYEATRLGYKVSHLVNFFLEEPQRVRLHGTDVKLIQLQSKAMGIPLVQRETSWERYENDFKATVLSLVHSGIKGMIFGDIYLEEHKDWVERVCADLQIKAIEPLWGMETGNILSAFIEAGFEAIVVSAKCELMDKEWIGCTIDRSFMEYLRMKGIDPCGEKGEYHTLVTYGPIFKKRIKLLEKTVYTRDDYWLLDTCKYQLENLS